MRRQVLQIPAHLGYEARSRAPGSEGLVQVRKGDASALHHSFRLEPHHDPLARSSDALWLTESETSERPIKRGERVIIHELEAFELFARGVETVRAVCEVAAPDAHESQRPRDPCFLGCEMQLVEDHKRFDQGRFGVVKPFELDIRTRSIIERVSEKHPITIR